MPGQVAYYPIGSKQGSVTISNDAAAANIYLVADGLLAVLGGTKFGDKFRKSSATSTAVQLVTELTDVVAKYHGCATGASLLKRGACDLVLGRDVAFALGRFSFSLGASALSKTASLVIAAAHQWKFTFHLSGDLNAVSNGHGTITLAALPSALPSSAAPTITSIADLTISHTDTGSYRVRVNYRDDDCDVVGGTWVDQSGASHDFGSASGSNASYPGGCTSGIGYLTPGYGSCTGPDGQRGASERYAQTITIEDKLGRVS